MDWFQIGKGVHQGCILSCCLFNIIAEYIMQKAGMAEAQAGIKIARRISLTSDRQMTPPLWHKAKRNWEPLDKSEREEWKNRLETQHSKNKDHGICSYHFISNRWGNNGNSNRLYFLALQNHCRWWWLQPWN